MSESNNFSSPGVLAYWFDISPDVTAEWLGWYLDDHMPSRIGSTFVAGRCYERIHGDASHMVMFEAESPESLLAPAYLTLLSQVSDSDRSRRAWYSHTVRVTCRVLSQSGRGTGSVLGVLRIPSADGLSAPQVRKCLVEKVLPAVTKETSVGGARVLEYDPSLRDAMDKVRITGHQDATTSWAVLIEGAHDAGIAAAMEHVKNLVSWRDTGLTDKATFERFRLLYAMTRSDPYPQSKKTRLAKLP